MNQESTRSLRGMLLLRQPGRLSRIRPGREAACEVAKDQHARGIRGQEGSALVETALSCAIFLMVLFGLMEISLALYTYNYVSDAARVATRYAAVRGANSCTVEPTFPNCNLSSASPGNPLQTWVRNLGYPGLNPNNLTVTATWLSQATASPATWSTCTTAICNNPGNAVKAVVSYQFPLHIPFWRRATITVSSTSQMVINE